MSSPSVTCITRSRPLRRAAVLLAAGLGALACLPATGAAAAARAPSPAVLYAPGSPGVQAAQAVARGEWGTEACGGSVDVSWTLESVRINARSYWSNPSSAYDDPALNTACRVVFNGAVDFDWPMFCTVLVHEYGHLTGHAHSADGPDVMSPIYRRPLPACSEAEAPSTASAPASDPGNRASSARASHRSKSQRARLRSRRH